MRYRLKFRALVTAFVLVSASCATSLNLKEPVQADEIEARLGDLGQIQKISNDRVDLVSADSAGPRPDDIAKISERNAEARQWMTVHVASSVSGVRERVIAISIENGGQNLVLEREVRSCFEPGQGLSGIPVGGGCVESETTPEDVEWFESTEAAIRARLSP